MDPIWAKPVHLGLIVLAALTLSNTHQPRSNPVLIGPMWVLVVDLLGAALTKLKKNYIRKNTKTNAIKILIPPGFIFTIRKQCVGGEILQGVLRIPRAIGMARCPRQFFVFLYPREIAQLLEVLLGRGRLPVFAGGEAGDRGQRLCIRETMCSFTVATRQGKVREKWFFSMSGKCQGILKFVREKLNLENIMEN